MRGDGRIYQRGRRWWIEYWVNGKSFRESGGKSRSEAKQKLKLRRQEILGGNFISPQAAKITIDELLDGYIRHLELKGARSVSSVVSDSRPIRERFGMVQARNLTPSMLERYMQDRLDEGKKPATVNRGIQDLRAAFRLAQKQGRVTRIPYFTLLKENNVRRGFFDRGDFEAVVENLPEPVANFSWWAYFTGWRKGEISSLRWEDVDRSARELRLRRSKNEEGRVLPLAGRLWQLIEKQWAAREYEEHGVTKLSPLVFHRNGRPIYNFFKSWRTALRKAGVAEDRKFHDLRRTGGRNLRRAGVSETVAMSITGHKTATMFRRYNISDGRDKLEALEKVESYFEAQSTERNVVPMAKAGEENPHSSRTRRLPRPTKSGSGGGTRTPDKAVNSRLLYQLSYSGTRVLCCLRWMMQASKAR